MTIALAETQSPCVMSLNLSLTKLQPRSLLSIAKLKKLGQH